MSNLLKDVSDDYVTEVQVLSFIIRGRVLESFEDSKCIFWYLSSGSSGKDTSTLDFIDTTLDWYRA